MEAGSSSAEVPGTGGRRPGDQKCDNPHKALWDLLSHRLSQAIPWPSAKT
ncbi:MAG: hypothetical protein R6U96_03690 [Promethearchaeia archaeon]